MVAERHLGRLTGSIQQIKTSTLSGKHTVGSGHGGQHIFYSAECIVSENLSAASAPGIKVITLRNGAYLHTYILASSTLHPFAFSLIPCLQSKRPMPLSSCLQSKRNVQECDSSFTARQPEASHRSFPCSSR